MLIDMCMFAHVVYTWMYIRHVCLHMWFTDTWMNMLIDMCMFAHVVYRYMDVHINRWTHVDIHDAHVDDSKTVCTNDSHKTVHPAVRTS